MKYLLLIAVVGTVLWWLRSRSPDAPSRRADSPSPQAQPMVACAHCGVHLPSADAVPGGRGSYCSEAHRLAHGERR